MSAPSKLTLFADDMMLYRTISSPADYIVLQSDITAISTWVAGNHLQLNSNKCCFMLISRKRFRSIPPPTLYIDSNTALTQVKSVKYLGIQLTCDLSWSYHITTICSKTRRLIGLLYRQFHLCAPETALRLYKTFYSTSSQVRVCHMGPIPCQGHPVSRTNTKICSAHVLQRLVLPLPRVISSSRNPITC